MRRCLCAVVNNKWDEEGIDTVSDVDGIGESSVSYLAREGDGKESGAWTGALLKFAGCWGTISPTKKTQPLASPHASASAPLKRDHARRSHIQSLSDLRDY